nr:amino acid ABC transporter permease [uncultured Campylobacter sp.]
MELLSGENLIRLLGGLGVTLQIALISIAISLILGLVLGILMASGRRALYIPLKICLEIVRIMPPIVWLFIVYFGVSKAFGIHISNIAASIIVFSIWGVFEMMDLVRGAVLSIPKHQFESAEALAFSRSQIYLYVILPLAMRRLVPATINLFSRMIKTTSIAVLIGVIELVKVGQQIIEVNVFRDNYAPLIIYGAIFFVYFLICYPISALSKKLENRWS